MELTGNLLRLAGAGAAIALSATPLVGAPSAQAAPVVNYQVVNGNSRNACLQVVNAHTRTGNVVLATCDRSAKQVWRIGGGIFRNPASNHCLDGNGTDVYTTRCNTDGYQKWKTTSGSPKYINQDRGGKYLHAAGRVGEHVVYKPSSGTSSRWVIGRV
ncbi:RICIN domain-containing protein [Streptomyces uncialis]|uniref:RICIN domain-containing protein n=1 Tax=Streptomyces uncialis TaxID=1048205 RepID=UPI0037A5B99E